MINRNANSRILRALVLGFVPAFAFSANAQSVATPPASSTTPPITIVSEAAPSSGLAPASLTSAASNPGASPTKPAHAKANHTISYTCVAGDTLTSLAKKFNTTRKKLKTLNDLASTKLKPGQVLLIPSTKSSKSSVAKAKAEHTYLVAQPVQDFDVPASTFASCPVPLPSPDDDTPWPSADGDSSEKPAPIAQLVSPAEAAEAEREAERETAAQPPTSTASNDDLLSNPGAAATQSSHPPFAPDGLAGHNAKPYDIKALPVASSDSSPGLHAALRPDNPPPAPASRNPFLSFFSGFGSHQSSADDWGSRFLYQARLLGDKGIDYDDDWRPPGENRSWTMDCSNTSRYLYQVTAGLKLPRTASDQYYYLHLQGKAWDVPDTSDGIAECEYLRHHLKPGDLLFWENTYRPERQPPITHVMVFLGTNSLGQWIMAGSQSSRGGEHNRRNGGPDVYVFRPTQPCGGYSTWMGLVHHRGRFCAFGRPLEADPSKLAVATDD